MLVHLEKAPQPSAERFDSERLHADFIEHAGIEAVGLVVEGIDGTGTSTKLSTRRMSVGNMLLQGTHPYNPDKVSLVRPMDRGIENAADVVGYLENASTHLTPEQILRRSDGTLARLRSESLSLSAPVPAGSEGKEAYDLTQRDRKMFESGSGGASRHESYATELFAGTLSPEIIDHIAENLDGKVIFNLGGGNAKISQELAQHGANSEVVNVEPYASDEAKQGQGHGYDHLLEDNPANPDFFEKSELPEHLADEIWAVYSVPAYLGTAEEVSALFDNMTRLIKPGGVIRISHLGVVDAKPGDPRVSTLIGQLENARDNGFLLERTKTSRGITLLMTAPEK